MRRIVGIVLLAAALLAITPATAFALDYYVETTGLNTNDGLSPGTAFLTIQHALDFAAGTPETDTVHVGAGTFSGSIAMRNGVSLSGGGVGATTLTAPGEPTVVTFAGLGTGETISGFTVSGGSGGIGTGVIQCTGSSPTISDNAVSGNSGGIYSAGIYCGPSSAPLITRNTISGNSAGIGGGGIYCDSSSAVIVANVIRGNHANMDGGGIVILGGSPTISGNEISSNSTGITGGGILCENASPLISNNVITGNSGAIEAAGIYCISSTVSLINNTIVGNTSSLAGGGVICQASTVSLVNCIVWGNSATQVSGATVTYSCVQGGTTANNNVAGDPRFRAAAGGDYRLRLDSPCIGAGTSTGAPAADILGVTRPQPALGGVDMGAYELPVYDVTFDAQGGSAVATQSIYEGNLAAEPADSTRVVHTFGGWYTDAACTTAWDFATPVTGATTLYAKWTLNTYAVTFDSQGGSAVVAQTVDHGSPATQPADPTRVAHTFGGWYTDAACTNAWDFATPIVAPTTLYAKWDPIVISGMNATYTMYVGERLTLDAKPDGGEWGWDPAYFSATFNSPATFTARTAGSSVITYTLNGVTQTATVTVLANAASAPTTSGTLPSTGGNLLLLLAAAAVAALAGVCLRRGGA